MKNTPSLVDLRLVQHRIGSAWVSITDLVHCNESKVLPVLLLLELVGMQHAKVLIHRKTSSAIRYPLQDIVLQQTLPLNCHHVIELR